jgi:hypothetical protein
MPKNDWDEENNDEEPYESYIYKDDEMVDDLHEAYVSERNRYIANEINQSNIQDISVSIASLLGWLYCLHNNHKTSGLFFALAIITVLFSYQFSQKASRTSVDYLDGYIPDYDSGWARAIPWFNYASLGFCAAGLLCALIN